MTVSTPEKRRALTRRLVVSAMLIAMAFALSYVKIWQMPLGGAVTLCSMLPICVISVLYGVRRGLACGFCYSLLQILQSGVFGWGMTPGMLAAAILLDYVLAFSVLGLAGLFRRKGLAGILCGISLSLFLRFACHFFSGLVLWTKVDAFNAFGRVFTNTPALYSLCYNGAFMLPELLFTAAAASLLFSLPQMKKLIAPE